MAGLILPGFDTNMELTLAEQTDLANYEAVIERGLKTFVDVGNALLAIRDARLYRETHGTFEDYCQERWGFTRQHANRLIGAASVMQGLEPISSILPTNLEQAKPLASLSPDDQRKAWQEAVDTAPDGKITGQHVASVAERYKPNTAPIRYTDTEDAPFFDDIDDGTEEIELPAPTVIPSPNRAYKNSSESNEWYTPGYVIDLARQVMGDIDLDPASSREANLTVKAGEIFSEETNGLVQSWFGRVWLNPPYGDDAGKFVNKLVEEYELGHVDEALLLVAARTDTQWFRRLRKYPRCFLFGRIKFIDGLTGKAAESAGFPSMAVYFGDDLPKFAQVFKEFGDVYTLWEAE
jgi:hypothetical protein